MTRNSSRTGSTGSGTKTVILRRNRIPERSLYHCDPPPNITGQLHMGHALDNTLQDILTVGNGMQGYAALWIPGTDHASIATEAKIVAAMKEEGLTKEDVGREGF